MSLHPSSTSCVASPRSGHPGELTPFLPVGLTARNDRENLWLLRLLLIEEKLHITLQMCGPWRGR